MFCFHLDTSAVLLDDLLGYHKAQPRSGGSFGGEEGGKELFPDGYRHPRAIILHLKNYRIVRALAGTDGKREPLRGPSWIALPPARSYG
jgi:hypothetical protein